MDRNDVLFLAPLLVISLIVRLLAAFLFIEEPTIPHDMGYYVEYAKFFDEGKPYDKIQSNKLPVVYGPATLVFYWGWSKIAGSDFLSLKIMPIVFDLAAIVVIYFIAKNIIGRLKAEYASFFYASFYLVLISSGALGNDDHIFMFFLLCGIFMAIEHRIALSGVLVGLASGFKPVPIAMAPLIMYYVYRKRGISDAVKFGIISALTFLIILVPFYLESGERALVPYTLTVNFEYFGAGGIAPINLGRIVAGGMENVLFYLENGEFIPFEKNPLKTTNKTPVNDFFVFLSKPLFYLSFLAFVIYAYLFKMKNPEIELFRNIVFLIFFSLLSSKVLTDLLFLYAIPALTILIASLKKDLEEFEYRRSEIAYFGIIMMAIIIFSLFYRERAPQNLIEGSLFAMFVVLAVVGTYSVFRKTGFASGISIFVLGCSLFAVNDASPLYVLKPLISILVPDASFGVETIHSYLIKTLNTLLSGFFVFSGAVLILLKAHNQLNSYQQMPS
ncbi:MAG: glycosyltransferase family 39 protein [Candidatus Anstonellales archaeon]